MAALCLLHEPYFHFLIPFACCIPLAALLAVFCIIRNPFGQPLHLQLNCRILTLSKWFIKPAYVWKCEAKRNMKSNPNGLTKKKTLGAAKATKTETAATNFSHKYKLSSKKKEEKNKHQISGRAWLARYPVTVCFLSNCSEHFKFNF